MIHSTITQLAGGKIPEKLGYFLFVYILATSENMVGDNFENFVPEVTKMHSKSSAMVGENLKNYLYGMAKRTKIHPSETALKR